MINIKTKFIGLLGNPLEHSFSPRMHNEAYSKVGLNYVYIPIEVKEDNIDKVLEGMKNLNYIGFNITIPYKIKIMQYLDEIDPLAEEIGSVNTVKILNYKFIGYNTDGLGFVEALKNEKQIDCRENKFLILGAGGAARAISMTLAKENSPKIYIANRTVKKAKELSENINNNIRKCSEYLDINNKDSLEKIINNVDILVNTANLGMYPNVENSPIETKILKEHLLVVDIIYNPVRTKLLSEAEEKGCKTQNGIGMLASQGAKAFEIWTNKKAPLKEMRKSLTKIIEEQSIK